MAQYKETVNTEKALNLIAKMLAGEIEQIDFTKIKVSDKDYSLLSMEELQKLEELEEIKQETLVSEKVLLDDNTVNVHGIIYNTDLENSYYLRTIGLYANDPDEGEILYSITPASHADYVPTPNGNNITTLIIDLKTVISGAIVNLQGNPSALVDVSMLNKKLDKGEGLEEEFDTGVKIVNELKKKQNKEDSTLKTVVKTIVGAINELYDELIKKATKTTIGRIKVGNNLTIDEDGTLHGNPEYTHPTGNGNNHIPANGASGNFLKWLSSGAAQWVNITWNDITGKPNSFTPSSHNHTKANITDFPTSMKNPNALEIKMNGQNPVSYDGAAAKSINITASGIGAEPAFNKNTGFNKPLGTTSNTVLEGAKLAEILGLTYGGSLNNSNTKTLNYAYYDNTTKKVYKCIKSTTLNYADSSCFEAISNNDLLSKLQNFIISSGSNTNGYYRKYSDGFIEQFGTFNFSGGTNASVTRSLPISMKTTNYIVVCNPNFALERNSAAWGIVNPTTKTTTTITFKKAHSETTDVYWYVCGY